MGTLTGTNLLDIARGLNNDPSGLRWLDADMLPIVNEAQRAVVTKVPRSNMATAISALMAAGTRQTVSGLALTRGIRVMELVRNFDAAGTTAGPAIRRLLGGRKWLDENRPDWHTDAASTVIEHYATDEEDPTVVWVWPPSDGTTKVQAIFSQMPLALVSLGTVISIGDEWANAMGYYLLFRMYHKNEPGSLSDARSQTYYNLFLQELGLDTQADAKVDRSKDE